MENPNLFANYPLDRAGHLRKNESWFATQVGHNDSFVLPISGDQPYVMPPRSPNEPPELGFLRVSDLTPYIDQGATLLFLGLDKKDRPYFALDLDTMGKDPRTFGPLSQAGDFRDARGMVMELPKGDPAILGQAIALANWHRSHGFCSACGTRTVINEAGYKRECPSCGAEHFPRTDPVVIMMVEKDDRALLGRSKGFPEGMFSALAGFVEPGESLEDAVAREVMEETGVKIDHVGYHSTQPWPYPHSLMIGCHARAVSDEISLMDDELEEARWFERGQILEALEGKGDGSLWVPPPLAIAHHLIKSWAYNEK